MKEKAECPQSRGIIVLPGGAMRHRRTGSVHPFPAEAVDSAARWPEHVRTLAVRFRRETDPAARRLALEELWPVLLAVMTRLVRFHSARWGGMDPDAAHDVAAEKVLDLLSCLDQNEWRPETYDCRQLGAFLSTTARNGVIDDLRMRGRVRPLDSPGEETRPAPGTAETETAETALLRRQFVAALHECAGRLHPRARTAWFLRVFLDLPSKEIGRHPRVGLPPTAVDMALLRARRAIRACMRRRGFAPDDMPPGTFALLWDRFREDLADPGEEP